MKLLLGALLAAVSVSVTAYVLTVRADRTRRLDTEYKKLCETSRQ